MEKHRMYTYQEKKFNALGRTGLLDEFREKINPDKIRSFFMLKYDQSITLQDARAIAIEVQKKVWEEEKEDVESMVDSILAFARCYDLTNLEGFAFSLHVFNAMKGKEANTEKRVKKIMDNVLPTIDKLRREHWDRFMRIIKEVS